MLSVVLENQILRHCGNFHSAINEEPLGLSNKPNSPIYWFFAHYRTSQEAELEAGVGIEPASTDLQSAA